MNEVIILIGSNIHSQKNIKICLFLLNEKVKITAYSKIWITKSFGGDGPDFLNLAVGVATPLNAEKLKHSVIEDIENQLGRIRFPDKYAPRTIDLDIIVFNDVIMDDDLWAKVFIAAPISDLRPALSHPNNKQSLQEVAEKLIISQGAELFIPPKDFFPV